MRIAQTSLRFLLPLALCLLATTGARGDEPPAAPPGDQATPKTEAASEAESRPAKPEEPAWPETLGDPREGEVPLPAADGWNAFLMLDNKGVGVWTVKSFQVFPRLACPEVVGIDDDGRCLVLTNYSGKWAGPETLREGAWLGGLEHGDIDPRIAGAELYTGSRRGNLFQVLAHPGGVLENRRIAHIEGRAINTLVAGDLDGEEGQELLVFTWPGGLYRVDPNGPHGTWTVTRLEDVAGRIRDAVVLPGPSRPREIATVSRNGTLQILTLTTDGPHWQTLYRAPMGMGRVALAPTKAGRPPVLYTTHDDGRILRHARSSDGSWRTGTIYLGPQGPRGIAAGRFLADPEVESVAIYGYSGKVEILARRGTKPWTVETVFRDPDKGHWIAVCEVDGRNVTDELVASGFGGRIVLLARPPGYGRGELATRK